MIAFLRNLVLEDFWLKLFSLALAILIWFTVTFVSQKDVRTDTRVLVNLPVSLLSSVEDVHNFKVNPDRVKVTVQGDFETLQRLQSEGVRARVDLTGIAAVRELRKPVEVSVPAGVTFLRVVPDHVQVILPPER
jgi:ubiquinone biosynthesis protein UbiJ